MLARITIPNKAVMKVNHDIDHRLRAGRGESSGERSLPMCVVEWTVVSDG